MNWLLHLIDSYGYIKHILLTPCIFKCHVMVSKLFQHIVMSTDLANARHCSLQESVIYITVIVVYSEFKVSFHDNWVNVRLFSKAIYSCKWPKLGCCLGFYMCTYYIDDEQLHVAMPVWWTIYVQPIMDDCVANNERWVLNHQKKRGKLEQIPDLWMSSACTDVRTCYHILDL
jgi:hypothetical protein